MIGKIIETAYRKNLFSWLTLFLKELRYANINYKKLKYDISKMKKIGHIYSPNADQKEMVISDIIYMNKFIDNANSLTRAKIQNKISKEQIVFFSDKKKWDNYQFCYFTYSPNTPTGKAEIFIFSMCRFYKIYILKRKDTIAIKKIVVNKDGNETELYNSNMN